MGPGEGESEMGCNPSPFPTAAEAGSWVVALAVSPRPRRRPGLLRLEPHEDGLGAWSSGKGQGYVVEVREEAQGQAEEDLDGGEDLAQVRVAPLFGEFRPLCHRGRR